MPFKYADLLSDCKDKGVCGLPEIFETEDCLLDKVQQLGHEMQNSKYIVVITGAGISTSVGIPDFRGPNGIWTMKNCKSETKVPMLNMDGAIPSYTHYALRALAEKDFIQMIISQNVDGLHLKSGLCQDKLIELHGNMYIEKCETCKHRRELSEPVPCIGYSLTGNLCGIQKMHGYCRGKMRDVVLNWDTDIDNDLLANSRLSCKKADLVICIGTSLRMMPCGELPRLAKKIAILNLQQTDLDDESYVVIHHKCDIVLSLLLGHLSCHVYLNWFSESQNIGVFNSSLPLRMYILSGKRKSGKDFIAESFRQILPCQAVHIMRISKPLKKEYANKHNLDLNEMLKSSSYKEQFRTDMVAFGEETRNKDPGYFCRMILDEIVNSQYKPILLLVDARRKTDLSFYKDIFNARLITIRILCNDATRIQRGWKLNKDVDYSQSECDLDDVIFDKYIENDDSKRTETDIEQDLKTFLREDLFRIGLAFE